MLPQSVRSQAIALSEVLLFGNGDAACTLLLGFTNPTSLVTSQLRDVNGRSDTNHLVRLSRHVYPVVVSEQVAHHENVSTPSMSLVIQPSAASVVIQPLPLRD